MAAILIPGRAAKGLPPTGLCQLNEDLATELGVVAFLPLNASAPYELRGDIGLPTKTNGPVLQSIPGYGLTTLFAAASTQYVSLGLANALQMTTNLSVAIWARFTAFADTQFLVAKDSDTGRSWALYYDSGIFCMRFAVNASLTGIVGTPTFSFVGRTGVADHFCATFTTTNHLSTFYWNGVSQGTGDTTADINASTSTSVEIGRRSYPGFNNPMDGNLWWAVIANRAWTPAQAMALYDPATRWDLAWVPGRRLYVDFASTPPTGRTSRLAFLGVS